MTIFDDIEELTHDEKMEKLRRDLNVESLNNTFENFKHEPGAVQSLNAFQLLASGRSKWKMLLCSGSTGTGKTHLCEATVIELYKETGMRPPVRTMAEMMRLIKKSFNRETSIKLDLDDIIRIYSGFKWLIIDDAGMGSSGSESEWGWLEDIINNRYRANLFTILTTNILLKDLPPRIVSRFQDREKCRIIENTAEDYRPKKGGMK